MGRAAPSSFSLIPMAPPIPPIAFLSGSLRENWKETITSIRTGWLLTDHPKCVRAGTNGTGGIRLNTDLNRVYRPHSFRSFPSQSKALQKEPIAGLVTEVALRERQNGKA